MLPYLTKNNIMEEQLEKKIKDLKEFIKEKTDQGTANYLGKEIREICGMVESEQCAINGVVKSLKEDKPETFELWMESKGYRQNSKKQWLKHVYTMDARTLNNFKLEYESL